MGRRGHSLTRNVVEEEPPRLEHEEETLEELEE